MFTLHLADSLIHSDLLLQ